MTNTQSIRKPYKFVNWDVPELENLKSATAYILRGKINNGVKLTREEKDWITEKVNTNSYSKKGIPVSGWMFPFGDILKRYWVKSHSSISEHYAVDKTSLRKMYGFSKAEIVEIA